MLGLRFLTLKNVLSLSLVVSESYENDPSCERFTFSFDEE